MEKIIEFSKQQGWKVTMINDEQCLTRIELDEYRIDIWDSPKKGITIGIYNDKTSRFLRGVSKKILTELIVDPDVLRKEKKGRLYKYNRLVKEI